MATRAFKIGLEKFQKKQVDFINDTISAMQVSLASADVANVAITALTNASPMVATSASHGFSNGDIVVGRSVGGNLAGNGTFVVGGVTTNTFNLLNMDGGNTTGSGAWTSGGTYLNLTKAANIGDLNAGRVGTDQTLAGKTAVGGLFNCSAFTFTAVSGTVDGIIIYQNNGSDAASFPLFWIDGKAQVTFASNKAATSTAVDIQKAQGPVASGVAATSSAGVLVTTNATVAQFARTMTVVSLPTGGVTAGDTVDYPTTGAGLPFTGGGGSYTYTPDTAANKLFNLDAL